MKAVKVTTESPELAERFNVVLADTIAAMESAGFPYVFIGGIASGGLGRPRSTRDIDLFVKPDDAERTLRALAKQGFRTERTDPVWLYKAYKDGILVDVIFKSKGEIYLDSEMYQRSITTEFHGRKVRTVAPEDLVIIKAAAHSEVTPGHWHDALALLSYAKLDWDYLVRRARRAPRRVLSLLVYAQSADIWIPNSAIDRLYDVCFSAEHKPDVPPVQAMPAITPGGGEAATVYGLAALHEDVVNDLRTQQLDVHVERTHEGLVISGTVASQERREEVGNVVREAAARRFPGLTVLNRIQVFACDDPGPVEIMK